MSRLDSEEVGVVPSDCLFPHTKKQKLIKAHAGTVQSSQTYIHT